MHARRAGHPAEELQVGGPRPPPPLFAGLTSVPVLLSAAVTPVMVDAVLAELPPLISEGDMHVSQMALSFLSTLALTHPASLGQLSGGSILQQLIALVRSPLLQGGALAAMLDFYQVGSAVGLGRLATAAHPPCACVQALVATETPGLGYMDLLRMLTGPVYAQSAALPHKQAYCSIAKCVAALTRACPAEGPAVVGQFIQVSPLPSLERRRRRALTRLPVWQDVKNSRSTDSIRLLALLSLGEVGHHVDLSSQPELKTVILDAFSSSSEEVRLG